MRMCSLRLIGYFLIFDTFKYTDKNSPRNFTQFLAKIGTYEQVGDYLILMYVIICE